MQIPNKLTKNWHGRKRLSSKRGKIVALQKLPKYSHEAK